LWKPVFDKYEAKLNRRAENTQLFQVIRVAGNKLQYQAFTATGELYDAFDIVKGAKKGTSQFIERGGSTATERSHDR
jgi:hypothetical protein